MASDKMVVTLSLASPLDLPVLAEINRLAYYGETIAMIAFKNWPAETNMYNFFTSRIKERMNTPNTKIFKATTGAREIVGFICWTLEPEKGDGTAELEPPAPGPTEKALQEMEHVFNMEIIQSGGSEKETLGKLIKGMKHYYLSTFVVTPKYQGRGIGSRLLQHCLEIADAEGLPTWLNAFPGSHDLYLRFGFEDVEHRDIDLNKFDHCRMRGFGIYRTYFMTRQPKLVNGRA